jgi:hypothetical protein
VSILSAGNWQRRRRYGVIERDPVTLPETVFSGLLDEWPNGSVGSAEIVHLNR